MISVSELVKILGPKGAFQLTGRLTRNYPRILMYHRFSEESQVGHVSSRQLETQFRYLKKSFNVVSMDSLISNQSDPRQKDYRPKVVITVDDGYEDFYSICYPLLKKYELPATFYVTTNFISGENWLWQDKLKWLIDNSEYIKEDLRIGDVVFEKSNWCGDKLSAWKALFPYLIRLGINGLEDFFKQFSELTDQTLPKYAPELYRSVTWAQLREMQDNGVTVGGHTADHYSLGHLSDSEVYQQVNSCKSHLDMMLGDRPRHFCFPNGQPEDVSSYAKECVEGAGFISSVLAYYSRAGLSDRYALSRHGVGDSWLDFQKTVWGIDRLGAIILNRDSRFSWSV